MGTGGTRRSYPGIPMASEMVSPHNKVLGKLACLVQSKILGIGTAERNWKQVKLMKSGQQSSIGSEKCKKQVALYGIYQQTKARARAAKLSFAGKLWEEADFKH